MLARVSDQDFSASLSVFGDTCAEPRCISFSEEASQEEDRLAAWIPRAGKTYYVVVSGADFDEAGDFQLEIIVSAELVVVVPLVKRHLTCRNFRSPFSARQMMYVAELLTSQCSLSVSQMTT
jgi:hypothetical protein